VIGKPIYLSLRLVNQGDSVVQYSDQQVAINNSMTITGPDGRQVLYKAPMFQTVGGRKIIRPGQTRTLFDRFDVTEQYAVDQAGRYRVQFNGRGLRLSVMTEEAADPNDSKSFKQYPSKLPSNILTMMIGEDDSKQVDLITSCRGTFELNKQIPVGLDCPVVKDVWDNDQRPFRVESLKFVEKGARLSCLLKIEGETSANGSFVVRVNVRGKEHRTSPVEVLLDVGEFLFQTECDVTDLPAVIGESHQLDLGPIHRFRFAGVFEIEIESIVATAQTAKPQPNVTSFGGAFKRAEPLPVNLHCPVVKGIWGNDRNPFKVESVEFVEKDGRLHCSVKIDGESSADGKFIIRVKVFGKGAGVSGPRCILGLRGFLFETLCIYGYLPVMVRRTRDLDLGSIHQFSSVVSFEVEIEIVSPASEDSGEPATAPDSTLAPDPLSAQAELLYRFSTARTMVS